MKPLRKFTMASALCGVSFGSASPPAGKIYRGNAIVPSCDEQRQESADSQFNLANALTGLKHLEEAVERYEKALALKPNFPEARNNLGFALQLLGRHEAASVQYEKALALRPNYAEAHNNLGNVLQFLQKFEAAIVQYENALKILPNHAEFHNNLGNAIAALGRHQEAITYYETQPRGGAAGAGAADE